MAGVYLSFPFCPQKCSFCNFASGVFPAELESEYTELLAAELRQVPWPWTPETVYLGGGTPSTLSPDDLRGLLSAIPGRPWREATIEAMPGTFTRDQAAAWLDAGIERVSLGAQSFVTKEVSRVGRKHNAEAVERDFAMLRELGFANLSLDLIAGLPGQTRESWDVSLDWVRRLAPEHISVYLFEVDDDSRLGREVLRHGRRYGAPDVPSDDQAAGLYEQAAHRLSAMGLVRYEISNFARPGFESIHNLKYWIFEPYLGFGADAHSFDGAARWATVETAREYVNRRRAGLSAATAEEPAHLDEERFFIGLRLMRGIQPVEAEWRRFDEPIRRFVENGLLERDGANLRLTERGLLISNEILQEFIATPSPK